ncbi:HAD-IB family hydrolase [Kitasatospora sp. GP82]|uniref:HAD-IB family hydrolase n=1 Tax=Kitasatospora sp. GP82 TaxID=3035089 RepID=UPI002473607B|nr:HAD-IB family hydrolase [Kitasatospora sp. GP82]MDH6129518.1 HAD superfamily hydrolase (TIGR01490 family) [Kitasatospora sp. GP82]
MSSVLPAPARAGLAFFDVDETVIAVKGMLDFWRFWGGYAPEEAARGAQAAEQLTELQRLGADRSALNRTYYRRFAGVRLARLEEATRQWYRQHRARPDAFVTATVAALDRHRSKGDTVVLVSGSCHALLAPLAEDLGGAVPICTEQLSSADGVLTGEVDRPMIGPAKAEAATALMAARGVDPTDCSAYGDHSSDLQLLLAVGNPAVVGEDPVLLDHAERLGWRTVPATAGALRHSPLS